MPGGADTFDNLGRPVPEYAITRWHDGYEWHDGAPSLATLKAHTGDPSFIMTIHFPSLSGDPDLDDHYNVVGGFTSWAELEVAIVDMFTEYTATGK